VGVSGIRVLSDRGKKKKDIHRRGEAKNEGARNTGKNFKSHDQEKSEGLLLEQRGSY